MDSAKFRERRTSAHLTQVELAEKIGKTRGFIWQLENDECGASAPVLADIAEALGCEISDLMADGEMDAVHSTPGGDAICTRCGRRWTTAHACTARVGSGNGPERAA